MNKKSFTFNSYEEEVTETPCTTLPNSNYNSFCNNSSQSSPDRDTDSISDNSKKIRKKRCTYQKIDDQTRIKLLDAVQEGETLKAAAKKYNINYSSAKSILHTFRKEGRILKKSAQERTARRRTKTSSDLEMSPIYPYKQSQEEYHTIPEGSTYQTYHSPDSEHSPTYGLPNQEESKAMVRGVSVNSFGGFYRVDSQSQQNIDNMNVKAPSSTVVFQLGSNGLQKLPSANTNSSMQSKNFQINVNVQKQNSDTNPNSMPMPMPVAQQFETPNPLKMSEKLRSFDSYYFASSPAPTLGHARREEPSFDKYFPQDFDSFAEMMTCPEEVDVSCFLNPGSPAYNFQQKHAENDYFGGHGDFSLLHNSRRTSEAQDRQYYDNSKKMASMENYKLKGDDATSGYVKAAGLRGY